MKSSAREGDQGLGRAAGGGGGGGRGLQRMRGKYKEEKHHPNSPCVGVGVGHLLRIYLTTLMKTGIAKEFIGLQSSLKIVT